MYLISTFHHSFELEILLQDLEKNGVERKDIMAVPLLQNLKQTRMITAASTGGNNLLDIPLAVGTATMLLGVIYGYVLAWGPILWGLIGLVGGTLLTLLVCILASKGLQRKDERKERAEVIVMVHCSIHAAARMEALIREYRPLGFAKLDLNS